MAYVANTGAYGANTGGYAANAGAYSANTGAYAANDGLAGCGEAAGCAGGEEANVLNFVGTGRGDYIQETTYKYVGEGIGDHQMTKVGGTNWCRIAAIVAALLALLVILLICLMPGEATTTTTTTGLNCNYGAVATWSVTKKAECCNRVGKGCPTTPAPTPLIVTPPPVIIISTSPPVTTPNICNEGAVDQWDEKKRTFCCARYRNGCPTQPPQPSTVPFDCQAGLTNWVNGWSVAKKAWCCQHEQKGCAPVTTTPIYDCAAGYANWQAGWAVAKKAWCCTHEGKGCKPKKGCE